MDYNSPRWQRLKEKVLRRDDYLCQNCKRYGKHKQAQHVHHVNPAEKYVTLRYNPYNLISLCQSCHNEMHERTQHELSDKGEQLRQRINRKYNLLP